MKAETIIEKIKIAATTAEKMTGKNLSLPALKSILLIAKQKSVIIKATNLDIGIEYEIPAKVEEEGVAAIPGAILGGMLSGLSGEEIVSIESVNNNVLFSTKKNSTVLKTTPYEDFPLIPKISNGEKMIISAEKLISGLRSVWYSAALSDIKPEIASVYLYQNEKNIVFVATDSFRLAEKKIENKKDTNADGVIVPLKNVSEIIRVFGERSGDIEILFNKNQISFENNGVYVFSRTIDGVFPDYQQIIPKEHTTEAIVLKKDFQNALKIATIFSEKFNQVVFTIKPKDSYFEIKSKNSAIGENTTTMDASISGEDIVMGFNAKYISDSMQSIAEDSILLQFNGPNKPLVIKGLSNKSFRYLVMPMNR
ncbi:MAG: DNA polymerase III subunit beta [Parcubacteria group bacterium]|nr:DNA polymerase III subunit beta [Parcubacteria group bacterium]